MRSSVFTQGEEVSTSFTDAVSQVLSEQTLNEVALKCLGDNCQVHVEGYGVVGHAQAKHEAHESHKLAGEAASNGNHASAGYWTNRASMFHKAIAKHDLNLKKGPGGHSYHGLSEAVEEKPDEGTKLVNSKIKKPVAKGPEKAIKEAYAPGTEVATSSGLGVIHTVQGGDEINDPFLKYVVKLHHEPQMRVFGHHEVQVVGVHEHATPKPTSTPAKEMVWGKVETKYKRALALGRKQKDKEKHAKKWFDENVDVIDEPVTVIAENAVHHHLTVTSGASGPGSSLNTSHPEKHWLVGEHMKGGHETHYMRIHVQHPWDSSKSYHTVVSGSGKGADYHPGHHVALFDDGNGRTHFPKPRYDRHNNYARLPGGGTHGVITHVAKHASEMKNWPHSGRIGLHVLK